MHQKQITQQRGCRFCDTSAQQATFSHGACRLCQRRIMTWNTFVNRCKEQRQREAFVIQLITEPSERPLAHYSTPAMAMRAVRGAEIWPLSTAQPIHEGILPAQEARAMLRFYLDTGTLLLTLPTLFDTELCYDWLYPSLPMSKNPASASFHYWNETLPGLAYPLFLTSERGGWDVCPGYLSPAPLYFPTMARIFQVPTPSTTEIVPAHVVHRIICTVAEQDLIAFP